MILRVMTFNANGIRSAANKGFYDWMLGQDVDVICIQETKAQEHQLSADVFRCNGYKSYFFDAMKKGYSGVALYLRHEPDKVSTGLGWHIADTEGRYIQADFGNLSIASLYLPSGTSGQERQSVKFDFMDQYLAHLKKCLNSNREFIICGDWNIAHKAIDLKNWKSNQKSSGFLPEERAWMDELIEKTGFVDAFRVVNQEPDQYTWWSNFGQAYAKNVGWRIDYQIITPNLKPKVKAASIYKSQKFSDHAPLIMEYDIEIPAKK